MFIWVCFLDPVEIPQPLGILGEFGLSWALPKTKSMNSLTLCPALLIRLSALSSRAVEMWAHPFSLTLRVNFLMHILLPAPGWGGKGVSSVSSRDIKRAVSRLRHLPGFFLRFLCSHFFPATFMLHFSMCNKFGCQFIAAESTVRSLSSCHNYVPGILLLIFNGRQNRTSESPPRASGLVQIVLSCVFCCPKAASAPHFLLWTPAGFTIL